MSAGGWERAECATILATTLLAPISAPAVLASDFRPTGGHVKVRGKEGQ